MAVIAVGEMAETGPVAPACVGGVRGLPPPTSDAATPQGVPSRLLPPLAQVVAPGTAAVKMATPAVPPVAALVLVAARVATVVPPVLGDGDPRPVPDAPVDAARRPRPL